jgi:hypothetical protein
MLTAWMLAATLQASPLDCSAFEAKLAQTTPLAIQPVRGERLGGVLIEAAKPGYSARFQIGDLVYDETGIELRSADPRFAELVLDPGGGPRHRCSAPVLLPSGWNARDAQTTKWNLKFEPRRSAIEQAPGALAAAEVGAKPVLAGYRAGATWPVYVRGGQYFLGLMHPDDGREETAIVTFASRAGDSPAQVLAKMPERFETLSIIPGLHTPPDYINLDGFSADGALLRVVLEFSEPLKQRIAATTLIWPK